MVKALRAATNSVLDITHTVTSIHVWYDFSFVPREIIILTLRIATSTLSAITSTQSASSKEYGKSHQSGSRLHFSLEFTGPSECVVCHILSLRITDFRMQLIILEMVRFNQIQLRTSAPDSRYSPGRPDSRLPPVSIPFPEPVSCGAAANLVDADSSRADYSCVSCTFGGGRVLLDG